MRKPKYDPVTRLLSILALKRGYQSVGEAVAVERYLMPYKPTVFSDPKTTEPLAYVVVTDPTSKTLFSCHTDTVHAPSDDRATMNNHVLYDANIGVAYKDSTDPTPLGADDGAGWWLMLEMIDAGVPGHYFFHVGEERGGIGSKGMADLHPMMLKRFDRAIAFDRRGTTSVITEQGWSGQCASDTFAQALADRLNETDPEAFAFAPDPTGIYTDTAEYAELIPECTNISCGYDHEHSSAETLDVDFLVRLRDACCTIDWETLPVERDPTVKQVLTWTRSKVTKLFPSDAYDIAGMTRKQALKYCKKYPEEAAEMLLELADELMGMYELEDTPELDPNYEPHYILETYDDCKTV